MQDHQEAMLKSLTVVAWADGRMDKEEREVIDGLLEAFAIEGDDAEKILEFAKKPATLDDVPLTDLSSDDRRLLLSHAVMVTWVDGVQDEKEIALLQELISKLRIPADEGKAIVDAANERAKRHLSLLK